MLDADSAISHFFDKSSTRNGPAVVGQLLFRMLDLDRAMLGDYFSRRTSKVVLKAFVVCFKFGGVRIDRALCVFLQSLHLAHPSRHSNPLDYVSDFFTGTGTMQTGISWLMTRTLSSGLSALSSSLTMFFMEASYMIPGPIRRSSGM